jgi:hypothetical protein
VAFGPQQLGVNGRELTARVTESLARVGLVGFGRRATHHPSHGEKRRGCLAGVLACEPSILVLDEPTSDGLLHGRTDLGVASRLGGSAGRAGLFRRLGLLERARLIVQRLPFPPNPNCAGSTKLAPAGGTQTVASAGGFCLTVRTYAA